MKANMISVIVPVYNVEPYLHKCVNSILAQTYTNLEIILVDDGSTDGSGTICDECAKKDPRITVIHKKNGGVSSARNTGLDAATGDYIAFVDADDLVDTNYFKTLMADAGNYNADIVNCNCIELENGYDGALGEWFKTTKNSRLIDKRETYFEDYIRSEDWYGTVVWGKIIKRELARSVHFEDIHYHEDKLYMMRLFNQSPVTYLDTYKGYYYIRWKTSASRQADIGGGKNWERAENSIYVAQQQLYMITHFADKEMLRNCAIAYARNIHNYLSAIVKADARDKYVAERPKILQYGKDCLGYKHIGLKYRLMLGLYRLNGSLYWHVRKILWKMKDIKA